MDDDLICNFKKCRKRLKGVAWVNYIISPRFLSQLHVYASCVSSTYTQVTSCSRILQPLRIDAAISLAIITLLHR